jgi:triphosphatase
MDKPIAIVVGVGAEQGVGGAVFDAIRQDDQPALHLAIGVVAGWQARDRIAVAKTLRKRWRRFKATPAFWGR